MECNYRHCSTQIEGKRKDAKYCCLNHKKMEGTYKKRKNLLLDKYKESELKKVELIKYLKDIQLLKIIDFTK